MLEPRFPGHNVRKYRYPIRANDLSPLSTNANCGTRTRARYHELDFVLSLLEIRIAAWVRFAQRNQRRKGVTADSISVVTRSSFRKLSVNAATT